jgi:hypothetical protein
MHKRGRPLGCCGQVRQAPRRAPLHLPLVLKLDSQNVELKRQRSAHVFESGPFRFDVAGFAHETPSKRTPKLRQVTEATQESGTTYPPVRVGRRSAAEGTP